jgi:hypothetical protein
LSLFEQAFWQESEPEADCMPRSISLTDSLP